MTHTQIVFHYFMKKKTYDSYSHVNTNHREQDQPATYTQITKNAIIQLHA
jgi:hypothetical protein